MSIKQAKSMKEKTLTKRHKRSIIKTGGRLSFLGVRNFFRRSKKIISNSSPSTFFKTLPHKGRKVSIMNNMISSSFGGKNTAQAIAIATLLAAAVSGCGGGGGGGSVVTPPTPATGTISATGCVVPDGSSACNASVTWSTKNASTPRVTVAGASVSSLSSGSGSFSISLGGATTVAVTDGITVLNSTSVSAVCGTSSAVVNGLCKPAALSYSDIIIANTDLYGWYPMKLVLTSGATTGAVTFSAEQAVNATSFKTGEWPLFNCIFNKVKLSAGGVKFNCVDRASLIRQNLVWSPVTNRLDLYDGSEGAYPAVTDATWVDVQTNAPPVVGWDKFAEIGAGWVWNSTTDGRTLHFKRKSDSSDTTLPLSIGVVKALWAFSN